MTYQVLVERFLFCCTGILGVCLLVCLGRTVAGPRVSDRLLAVNMAGTEIICIIAMITVITGETGFADIAVIYAVLSFVSVVVLTKILSGKRR